MDGLETPTVRDVSTAWRDIKRSIDLGLRLEEVITEVSRILTATQSERMSALIGFIAYSRMTPQKMIRDAFLEYSNFPWKFVLDRYGALASEKQILDSYFDLINNDPLMGLKEQGISTTIPNLCYLSFKLHLEIGSKLSLKQYRGIGSDENTTPIPMKLVIDALIKKFKEQTVNLELEWPEDWQDQVFSPAVIGHQPSCHRTSAQLS